MGASLPAVLAGFELKSFISLQVIKCELILQIINHDLISRVEYGTQRRAHYYRCSDPFLSTSDFAIRQTTCSANSKRLLFLSRYIVTFIINFLIRLSAVRYAVSRISYQQFTNVFFDVSIISLGHLDHYVRLQVRFILFFLCLSSRAS